MTKTNYCNKWFVIWSETNQNKVNNKAYMIRKISRRIITKTKTQYIAFHLKQFFMELILAVKDIF